MSNKVAFNRCKTLVAVFFILFLSACGSDGASPDADQSFDENSNSIQEENNRKDDQDDKDEQDDDDKEEEDDDTGLTPEDLIGNDCDQKQSGGPGGRPSGRAAHDAGSYAAHDANTNTSPKADTSGGPTHDTTSPDGGTTTPDGGSGDYQSGEEFAGWKENEFVETATENTSTFSVDVDNASYTLARRDLNNGKLPKPESVRTEEFINFFDYDYRKPVPDRPFSINMEVGPSKFGQGKHLLQVGLRGKQIPVEKMSPTNLVFLLDASGSMDAPDKLPLVKRSMFTLLNHLRPEDTVGIVVYAGSDSAVLEPTKVKNKEKILNALADLCPGGSTNAEAGIKRAYEMAERAKKKGGNNRVILATDGDFNVGKRGEALTEMIVDYRKKHISLTGVGFGMGNYKGDEMSSLTQKANGNYFYVDSKKEAKRIFGEKLPSTLEVIASDVKVQVEFKENVVKKYRLVGYETRQLANKDFADDSKDAAELGPGHTVTALYEIELHPPSNSSSSNRKNLLAGVDLRYKDHFGEQSNLLSRSLKRSQINETFEESSSDFRFATAVTEFAEILRESKYSDGAKFGEVKSIAKDANPANSSSRSEFVDLVDKASSLWNER